MLNIFALLNMFCVHSGQPLDQSKHHSLKAHSALPAAIGSQLTEAASSGRVDSHYGIVCQQRLGETWSLFVWHVQGQVRTRAMYLLAWLPLLFLSSRLRVMHGTSHVKLMAGLSPLSMLSTISRCIFVYL
jgi:hypothetical protein